MRVDHGSEFDSSAFDKELSFLLKSSAFVRSPECNGVIERFHRTLKEQLTDIYAINDLEMAKKIMKGFIEIEYRKKYILSGITEPGGSPSSSRRLEHDSQA